MRFYLTQAVKLDLGYMGTIVTHDFAHRTEKGNGAVHGQGSRAPNDNDGSPRRGFAWLAPGPTFDAYQAKAC